MEQYILETHQDKQEPFKTMITTTQTLMTTQELHQCQETPTEMTENSWQNYSP